LIAWESNLKTLLPEAREILLGFQIFSLFQWKKTSTDSYNNTTQKLESNDIFNFQQVNLKLASLSDSSFHLRIFFAEILTLGETG
jgi:hypothetical protein